MRILKNKNKLEHGQIIPMVVVGIFVLIGMSALILDGGAILLNRRSAQNAADAGALAGARVLCKAENPNNTDIYNAIEQYTITENQATSFTWEHTTEQVGSIEGLTKGEIVVTAEVEHGSFFAKIFGEDTLRAQATAGAGCFPYQYSGVVLPFAYPCRTSLEGSESDDCDYVPIDWDYIEPLLNQTPTEINDTLFADHKDHVYIVVNSDKFCADQPHDPDPTNEIVCNLYGTDRYQLNSSAHGWLNLSNGNIGTSTLQDWISGDEEVKLPVHTWLSFAGGARANPVFSELETRLFDVVWIPVFNWICDDAVEGSACYNDAHVDFPLEPGQDCEFIEGSPGQEFAHIVAFAPFFPTCVRIKKTDSCLGFEQAVSINPDLGGSPAIASFEGYFIDPDTLSGDWVGQSGADLGMYQVSLTR